MLSRLEWSVQDLGRGSPTCTAQLLARLSSQQSQSIEVPALGYRLDLDTSRHETLQLYLITTLLLFFLPTAATPKALLPLGSMTTDETEVKRPRRSGLRQPDFRGKIGHGFSQKASVQKAGNRKQRVDRKIRAVTFTSNPRKLATTHQPWRFCQCRHIYIALESKLLI